MKILLLGAAGFIGTNLTIELAKNTKDEITLIDRNIDFFNPIINMNLNNVHIEEASLTVDMDFDSILKKSRDSLSFGEHDSTNNFESAYIPGTSIQCYLLCKFV